VELGSAAFWVALLQIIGINIVLSGDNAVVIALAARSLPPQQQKQAIFWGSAAAVAMRIVLTIVAVELLRLPALKLVGSGLLLWIAVQLLIPEEEEGEGGADSATGMMAAIRTILIADLVMSLDNVIGVAAAAKGSLVLLVVGLAISIPLVVFASTFLLRVMERFPVIVTLGAGLLGWVAGDMAVSDPLVAEWVSSRAPWLHTLLPAAGAAAVIATGKWLAARAERGEEAGHVAEIETGPGATAAKEAGMLRLLLPIDGSEGALRAIERLLAMRHWYREPLEVHLLNVQHLLHKDVGNFVAAADIRDFHQEEGMKELAAARARLDEAGVPYRHHVVVGELVPETIAHFAREQGIGQILMCTHGRTPMGDLLLGSVAHGVVHNASIPVTLVK